jgi:dienelactone hydrolase
MRRGVQFQFNSHRMKQRPSGDAQSSRPWFRSTILSAMVAVVVAISTAPSLDAQEASESVGPQPPVAAQPITFKSGGLSLVGVLYKPEGNGPFPALIWNHGSEGRPDAGPQFDSVASIFVPAGYVVFAPVRRGQGRSEGSYIIDTIRQTRITGGKAAANRLAVHLLESEQLDDQLAGLAYVKQLSFVDPHRIAVAGCSFGGIQTLLGVERGVGYRAAISISPAALSWGGNPFLQNRLIRSMQGITVPTLLLQPAKDASLKPSRVLGAEAARLGKPLTTKVYPATGPEAEQKHCFGGAKGMHVWAADAKAFLEANLR